MEPWLRWVKNWKIYQIFSQVARIFSRGIQSCYSGLKNRHKSKLMTQSIKVIFRRGLSFVEVCICLHLTKIQHNLQSGSGLRTRSMIFKILKNWRKKYFFYASSHNECMENFDQIFPIMLLVAIKNGLLSML